MLALGVPEGRAHGSISRLPFESGGARFHSGAVAPHPPPPRSLPRWDGAPALFRKNNSTFSHAAMRPRAPCGGTLPRPAAAAGDVRGHTALPRTPPPRLRPLEASARPESAGRTTPRAPRRGSARGSPAPHPLMRVGRRGSAGESTATWPSQTWLRDQV